MLSFKATNDKDAFCLRDLIFTHYLAELGDEKLADRCTKAFTDLLAAHMRI
jgi:hypothetical protein